MIWLISQNWGRSWREIPFFQSKTLDEIVLPDMNNSVHRHFHLTMENVTMLDTHSFMGLELDSLGRNSQNPHSIFNNIDNVTLWCLTREKLDEPKIRSGDFISKGKFWDSKYQNLYLWFHQMSYFGDLLSIYKESNPTFRIFILHLMQDFAVTFLSLQRPFIFRIINDCITIYHNLFLGRQKI